MTLNAELRYWRRVCYLIHQDVPWASVTRRGQQPVGSQCRECAELAGAAWPLKEWDSLCLEYRSSPEMQKQWNDAMAVKKGAERKFGLQSYQGESVVGYIAEREWDFMPLKKFIEKYEVDPSVAGIQVDSIETEFGIEKGILTLSGDLKVRTFYSSRSVLADLFFQPSEQLRESQGQELAKAFRDDNLKMGPRVFSKPADFAASSQQAMEAKIEGYKKKVREEEVRRAAEEAALPTAEGDAEDQEMAPAEEEQEQEESEDEVVTVGASALKLPSAQAKEAAAAKRRRKREADTRTQRRKQAKVLASLPGDACSTKLPSDSDSVFNMSVSGRSAMSGMTQQDKLMMKAETWLKQLQLSGVLSTASGREIWQAESTLKALEKANPGCSEAVRLRARIEAAKLAEDIGRLKHL